MRRCYGPIRAPNCIWNIRFIGSSENPLTDGRGKLPLPNRVISYQNRRRPRWSAVLGNCGSEIDLVKTSKLAKSELRLCLMEFLPGLVALGSFLRNKHSNLHRVGTKVLFHGD